MPTMRCAACGAEFDASRSDAKYCSNRCKQRAKRERAKPRPVWTRPPSPPKPASREVEAAFIAAHRVANDLGRLAANGPYQLRAACARVSSALQAALEAEGL